MADKVMTIAGAGDEAVTPAGTPAGTTATTAQQALSQVVSGWTWKNITATVVGSFAVVGGGAMAYYGFTRSRKGYKWGGIIVAAAGVVSIGVAILLAHLRKTGVIAGLLGGYGTTPADAFVDPNRVAERGDFVALQDGRRAKVNGITRSLDGSATYDLRLVDGGMLRDDEVFMKADGLAGVIVAR